MNHFRTRLFSTYPGHRKAPAWFLFFFFQAEDGIRDHCVTGVQTCALPISMTWTRLPNRAKAWASSQPIGPAPMTPRRGGNSVNEKIVSLVRKPASCKPGIAGAVARAPVQI